MRKGIKTIICGVVLFVIGAVVLPFLVILPFVLSDDENVQFEIPGSIEISLEEPGRYYLWNDYETVFNGTSYNGSEDIPGGIHFEIIDENEKIYVLKNDISISSSSGSNSRNSIGYIEIENPTTLYLTVSGEVSPRVFSLGLSDLNQVLVLIVVSFGGSAIGAVGGIGLMIWGIVKLVKSSKKTTNSV